MSIRDVVFGDESGTQGDGAPYVFVGGYIASPRQWAKFDVAWREALGRVGAFHAKEFFQINNWRSSRNPHHGWTQEQGAEFLQGLLSVISWHLIKPIGGAVDRAAFDAQSETMRRYVTGSFLQTHATTDRFSTTLIGTGAPSRPPYQAALRLLMVEAHDAARRNAKIDFVLDENSENEALTRELFRQFRAERSVLPVEVRDRFGGVSFESDKDFPGLQAADLLCYLWNAGLTKKRRTRLLDLARDALVDERTYMALLDSQRFLELERMQNNKNTSRLAQWRSGIPLT